MVLSVVVSNNGLEIQRDQVCCSNELRGIRWGGLPDVAVAIPRLTTGESLFRCKSSFGRQRLSSMIADT